MTILRVVCGDVCDAKESFIAHIANCVTKNAKGAAAQLFDRFPAENIYEHRAYRYADEPGTVKNSGRLVHMFAQWAPGKPGAFHKMYRYKNGFETVVDDASERLVWFRRCLTLLKPIIGNDPVAIPFGIGCGIGGGVWSDYERALQETNVNIVLYAKETTAATAATAATATKRHAPASDEEKEEDLKRSKVSNTVDSHRSNNFKQ